MVQTQNLHTLEMFLLYQNVAYKQQQHHNRIIASTSRVLCCFDATQDSKRCSKSALVPIRCLPPHDRAGGTAWIS